MGDDSGLAIRARAGSGRQVGDQGQHGLVDLSQFAERLELRQLCDKLIGIEWINRTLRLKLGGQQLQKLRIQAAGGIARRG